MKSTTIEKDKTKDGKRFFEPEDDYKPEFLKKKTSLLDRFYKFYIKLRYFKS